MTPIHNTDTESTGTKRMVTAEGTGPELTAWLLPLKGTADGDVSLLFSSQAADRADLGPMCCP